MKKGSYIKIYLFVLLISASLYLFYKYSVQDYYFSGSDKNVIIFRLAEAQTENYPSTYASNLFAKLVEEKSAGRIKIKVYNSGVLGTEESVIEQVQFGGIDFARVNLASLAKYSPAINVLMLPYLIKDDIQMNTILESSYGTEIKEALMKEKISCLSWFKGGKRGFYSSKKYIFGIEDLAGLKVNAIQPQMMTDFYLNNGVHIVSHKQNDLYGLLQSGAIDGVEGSLISYYVSRHYEIAPYFTDSKHVTVPEVLICSRSILLNLSKDDQSIIMEAAEEAGAMQKKVWDEMEKNISTLLIDKQIKLENNFQKNDFSTALNPIYQSFDQNVLKKFADY